MTEVRILWGYFNRNGDDHQSLARPVGLLEVLQQVYDEKHVFQNHPREFSGSLEGHW